jgi:hypothetical protein
MLTRFSPALEQTIQHGVRRRAVLPLLADRPTALEPVDRAVLPLLADRPTALEPVERSPVREPLEPRDQGSRHKQGCAAHLLEGHQHLLVCEHQLIRTPAI